ncbi:MAG: Nuclease [Chlamydiae bacterium]|nr:Nuclease [Chlamydiota bacterium]
MAKRKRKTQKASTKKRLSRWQVFFLGVFVGTGLFWLPEGNDFAPAQFSRSEWTTNNSPSVFANHLPTTTPLIEREGLVISYDGRTRNPYWVYHKLTSETLDANTSRADCDFKEDPLIPKAIRATKSDYHGSGFDRGHLCPAADTLSQKTMQETFLLSNIAPQFPAFNRGYWKKVENHIRSLTKEYRVVHVFSGPLYLSTKGRDGKRYVKYQVIGSHNIAVPTHFFALLFVEHPSNKMMTKAFILPNKSIDAKTPLKKYSATVEEVEIASGVLFTKILE